MILLLLLVVVMYYVNVVISIVRCINIESLIYSICIIKFLFRKLIVPSIHITFSSRYNDLGFADQPGSTSSQQVADQPLAPAVHPSNIQLSIEGEQMLRRLADMNNKIEIMKFKGGYACRLFISWVYVS